MVEAYNQDNAFILQNGPFGPVDNTTYFSGHDATSQFVDNPPANYVKLVDFAVRSGYVLTGYEYAPMDNCMYLGVDPDRRIIYVGDSQFTHTILDNIDSGGAIDGSPMNTLWLNIWAWIAQTVVAL